MSISELARNNRNLGVAAGLFFCANQFLKEAGKNNENKDLENCGLVYNACNITHGLVGAMSWGMPSLNETLKIKGLPPVLKMLGNLGWGFGLVGGLLMIKSGLNHNDNPKDKKYSVAGFELNPLAILYGSLSVVATGIFASAYNSISLGKRLTPALGGMLTWGMSLCLLVDSLQIEWGKVFSSKTTLQEKTDALTKPFKENLDSKKLAAFVCEVGAALAFARLRSAPPSP
jgi:hypothetical protein